MRFNSESQTALSKRIGLRRVDLFVLTTYTDRDALTVADVFYWSDAFRVYNYNGTGTLREFLPVVRTRTGPDALNMTHIQDFGGNHSATCELILANRPTEPGGPYLIEQLRDRLFRATIEVVEVLIRADQDECDLSNLPGDQHTVVYRGETRGPVKIDQDTFTLQFDTIPPTIPWLIANGVNVDPDDLGKRYPIVYGQMKMVECVGIDVGASATLSGSVTAVATTIPLSSTSRFQNSGVIWIGSERITFSGKNSNALTGCVRGTSSTTATPHGVGDVALEVRDSVFAAAGHPVKAIGDVFTHRSDGEVVKITAGVTTDPIAETLGPNGETIAVIYVSAAQFETLIQDQEIRQGRVTQQPSVSQQTEIETIALRVVGQPDGDIGQTGWGPENVSASGTNPEFAGHPFSPLIATVLASEPQSMTVRIAGPGGFTDAIENNDTTDDAVFALCVGRNPADGNSIVGATMDGLEGLQAGGAFWVSERFTIPANGSIPAFDVVVPISDLLRYRVFDGADGNRESLGLVLDPSTSEMHDWTDLTGGDVAALSIEVEGLFQSTITTDIEVAGNDASIVKTEVGARGGAHRLKLYANVDGWTDDGLTTGVLLEDFPDIADHLIEVVCGVTNGGDHSETRPFADASLAGLPHACDLRSLGESFPQIIARLGWESRCNVVRTEGQVTPAAIAGTVDALAFNGADESMVSGDDFPDALGIANTWTVAYAMRIQSVGNTGSQFVQVDDLSTQSNGIYFGEATASNLARIFVYDDDGAARKTRTYDLTAYTIGDGFIEIPVFFLTWNGTDLHLYDSDGVEITPVASPDDDAITQLDSPRFVLVGVPYEGDFVGWAAWNTVLGTAEQAAVTTLMRGGSALTSDSGAYVSSAALKQHFQPGLAGEETYAVALDSGVEGLLTDGDPVGVSDIIDTDGFEVVRLAQLLNGFSVPTGPATVTALLEHGDDPGLADATTVADALILGADIADFGFEITADSLTAGVGSLVALYDVAGVGAKRYLRMTYTAAALASGETIAIALTTRVTPAGGHPGAAWIRNEVTRLNGGINPAGDQGGNGINADDLVELPASAAAGPGNTFYRYLPAASRDDGFRFGFPYTNDTSEDALGVVLDQYVSVSERPRDPENIKNRFRVLYAWDASRGRPGDGDAFRQTIVSSREGTPIGYPGPGLLAQSEAKYGRRDEEPMLFLTIQVTVTALDTLAYLEHVALLDTRTWEQAGVPWEIAYGLDLGDTAALPEVPWAPDEAWIVRVLGIAREPDTGMANLTLLGVQRRGVFEGIGSIAVTGAAVATHAVGAVGAGLIAPTGAGTAAYLVSGTGAGLILSSLFGAGVVIVPVRAVGGGGIMVTGSGLAEWSV